MRRPLRSTPLFALALVVAALAAGCGGAGDHGGASSRSGVAGSPAGGLITHDPARARVALTIGSKSFTEQEVLAEIYARGLAAAGYRTRTRLDLGDEHAALNAVRRGEIDAYPEYTGTALLSFFGHEPEQVPRDAGRAYREAQAGFAKLGLIAFPPTPFTDSNGVAVTRRTADRLGLQDISDLRGKSRELTLYGSPECRRRLDCLLGLRQVYKLTFKAFTPVPVAQRHRVLVSGRADVSIVFTTDPQIKREGEVLLQDDKGMFPPYNATLVMRKRLADQAGPHLRKLIEQIDEPLTDAAMQELNARVDLDKKDPAEVAREYLNETGLVK